MNGDDIENKVSVVKLMHNLRTDSNHPAEQHYEYNIYNTYNRCNIIIYNNENNGINTYNSYNYCNIQ
jgi:hypothetical protein